MSKFSKTILLASILVFLPKLNGNAQNVQKILDEVYLKIDNEEYEDANTLLCSIDDAQIATLSDSCYISINYYKGSCLYGLFRYEEAIPFLKETIHLTEKRPYYMCLYISSLYMLGDCYNNQEQYDKAEHFLRKVMVMDYEDVCNMNNTTKTLALYNLTVIYNKQGYTELENECVDRIRMGIVTDTLTTWTAKVQKLGKLSQWLYSNHLNEKADSILGKRINVGREDKNHNVWICCAYIEDLILKARNNEVDKVEKLLDAAIVYFGETKDFEFNEVMCSLYMMIGFAFLEAGNFAEKNKYYKLSWKFVHKSECELK